MLIYKHKQHIVNIYLLIYKQNIIFLYSLLMLIPKYLYKHSKTLYFYIYLLIFINIFADAIFVLNIFADAIFVSKHIC